MTEKTETATTQPREGKTVRPDVVVDVRFHPNGLVNMINRKPANMEPQDWFDFLCKQAAPYRPYAGGRGSFTISSDHFDAICAFKQAAE